MLHALPDPQSALTRSETRNPWAIVDVLAFGLFFALALFAVMVPFAGVSIMYAIPLQGVFDGILVLFIAGWVRLVRRTSFTEYIHLFRNRVFSKQSLIALGATCAISVIFISNLLPVTGQSPLEKLLNTTGAILLYAVFGVAVAPMLEEIIFRGFLFQALWEIGGYRFAIPVTAALFALLHAGQLAGNWGYVVLIFAVGCILSVVRHRSNSIVPSLIVHTSYNATLFVLFALSTLAQKLLKAS